ncbi:MAG: hypothetical protein KDE28_21220 [Anaerolineales bacterium]|nr:hypothetical protein [Anaerolineales bacterium]MCB0030452.1 hypothetical protein [Anaerolineales bacterium]MCB1777717.1 hypothetical protein [Candidatus Competibacteraceae bacterium]
MDESPESRIAELEKQLAESEHIRRLLESMLSALNFELNNRLTSILAYSTLLHSASNSEPLSKSQTKYAGRIEISAMHLSQMVQEGRDLLSILVRDQMNLVNLRLEPFLRRVTKEEIIVNDLLPDQAVIADESLLESLLRVALSLPRAKVAQRQVTISSLPEQRTIEICLVLSAKQDFEISTHDLLVQACQIGAMKLAGSFSIVKESPRAARIVLTLPAGRVE